MLRQYWIPAVRLFRWRHAYACSIQYSIFHILTHRAISMVSGCCCCWLFSSKTSSPRKMNGKIKIHHPIAISTWKFVWFWLHNHHKFPMKIFERTFLWMWILQIMDCMCVRLLCTLMNDILLYIRERLCVSVEIDTSNAKCKAKRANGWISECACIFATRTSRKLTVAREWAAGQSAKGNFICTKEEWEISASIDVVCEKALCKCWDDRMLCCVHFGKRSLVSIEAANTHTQHSPAQHRKYFN